MGIPAWLRLSQSDNFGRNYFIVRVTEAIDDEDEGYLMQQLPCSASSSATPLPSPMTTTTTTTITGSSSSNGTAGGAGMGGKGVDGNGNLMKLMDSAGEHAVGVDAAAKGPQDEPGRRHIKSLDGGESNNSGSVPSSGMSSGVKSGELGKQQQQRRRRQRFSLDDSAQMLQKIHGAPWVPRRGGGGGAEVGMPIPGLVMGPLVGKGGYGRIYRGIYQGQPVAVKVRGGCGAHAGN